ncbi:MAG: hypothetical protein V5A59_06835 [Bacteroidales bacterium]|nr:hypothetical protein [Bacteroidales bacterium]MBS3776038.1 hypothetical protein [Bacteroidales bacterium]
MNDLYFTFGYTNPEDFIGSESEGSGLENRVSITVDTDQLNEPIKINPTIKEIGGILSIPQKKEKYFLRAIKNLKIQNNFYELALHLEEGQITEEEYDEEIDNHPEKYVVSEGYLDDPNDIEIIRGIMKKVGLEFSIEEASEIFSIEPENLENNIIENE